jgi:hypothetical protein
MGYVGPWSLRLACKLGSENICAELAVTQRSRAAINQEVLEALLLNLLRPCWPCGRCHNFCFCWRQCHSTIKNYAVNCPTALVIHYAAAALLFGSGIQERV